MKTIELTRGLVAIVDDEDYERLSAWKWHAVTDYRGESYACRHAKKGEPGPRYVLMHRMICQTDKDVDHRNGDGLDNRRENLRPATRSQNIANSRPSSSSKSGLKGVDWHRQRGKWRAQITVLGRHQYLGLFATALEAAAAYDRAAVEAFGEFARTNLGGLP